MFRLPSTLRRNFSAFGTVAIVEVRSTGQQEIQERLAAGGYSVDCGSKSSLQRTGRWRGQHRVLARMCCFADAPRESVRLRIARTSHFHLHPGRFLRRVGHVYQFQGLKPQGFSLRSRPFSRAEIIARTII